MGLRVPYNCPPTCPSAKPELFCQGQSPGTLRKRVRTCTLLCCYTDQASTPISYILYTLHLVLYVLSPSSPYPKSKLNTIYAYNLPTCLRPLLSNALLCPKCVPGLKLSNKEMKSLHIWTERKPKTGIHSDRMLKSVPVGVDNGVYVDQNQL